jgi:hypothetical protein
MVSPLLITSGITSQMDPWSYLLDAAVVVAADASPAVAMQEDP